MQNQLQTKYSKLIWVYAWFVCVIAAFFYCYEYLLRITPSVMTVELRATFGNLSQVALGNLSAYYYYAYTPMQLPVGVLIDRYGPRYLLALACLVCTLGAYLFAITEQYWIAAAGRFLMGFGSAFAFVGVMSLASIWLPPHNFAMVAGMATTLGMIGAMQGEIILAQLVEDIGWQQSLIYFAYAGILLTFIIYFFVRDKSPLARMPFKATKNSWQELFQGLLHILKNKQIWIIGTIGALLFLSLSAFAELWGASYLQVAYGMSRVDSAKAIGMVFLGWAVGGPIMGFISDKLRRRVIPITIGALFAAIFAAMFLYLPGLSHNQLLIILFCYGLSCSVQVIVFALGRENSPLKLAAISISIVNMLVMLGGVIFQPLIGKMLDVILANNEISNLQVYSGYDYKVALIILPIAAAIAALLSLLLKDTHCVILQK